MTSFAPKDFGTGKWAGGQATISAPLFRYRRFTPQVGKNAGVEVKNTALFMEFVDAEGNPRKAQYDVGSAEYCVIKDGPGEGADSVEEGPSFGSADPTRPYKLYPDSDFAKFAQSLVLGGFPESKLEEGDITLLDGLEVEVVPTPRKEGDKFPLYLIKPGSVKLKGGAKRGGAASAASGDAKSLAEQIVKDNAAGDAIPQASLIKAAMALLKKDHPQSGSKAEVVKLLSTPSFLEGLDGVVYDAGDKTVQFVG